MGKQAVYSNPKVLAAQDELDRFLDFCRDFGYRFNEADLYNFKSYAWQQYNKYSQGKNARDMWAEDARRLNRNIAIHYN
jgi:hypothetical protein